MASDNDFYESDKHYVASYDSYESKEEKKEATN